MKIIWFESDSINWKIDTRCVFIHLEEFSVVELIVQPVDSVCWWDQAAHSPPALDKPFNYTTRLLFPIRILVCVETFREEESCAVYSHEKALRDRWTPAKQSACHELSRKSFDEQLTENSTNEPTLINVMKYKCSQKTRHNHLTGEQVPNNLNKNADGKTKQDIFLRQ